MNQELKLDISYYYGKARDLRSDLKRENENSRLDAAGRFRRLKPLEEMDEEEILKKKLSLRQAKQVIAIEEGFPDWPELRLAIEGRIDEIQGRCEGRYLPKGLPNEPGDIVEGDLILLGTFSGVDYVVDAILMDLFEATPCNLGPGVVLLECDDTEFNPDEIPDLPDDDDGWIDWSERTARALGIKGA